MNAADSRLKWLLLALVLIGGARLWLYLQRNSETPPAIASALPRSASIARAATAMASAPPMSTAPYDTTPWDEEIAVNAFAPRLPPVPSYDPAPVPAPAPAKPQTAVQPVVVAAAPARPIEQPPLKVIGTWKDATGTGLFVTGPSGTALARVGTVLMGEYTVTALTPQLLSLRQIATRLDFQIPVPR